MAETTRDRLLAATKSLLMEIGWSATTGRAIHRRAATCHGSWMHSFPKGKEQAAAEIYTELHEQIWANAIGAFRRAHPKYFEATIKKALDAFFESVRRLDAEAQLYFQLARALPDTHFGDTVRRLYLGDCEALGTWYASTKHGLHRRSDGEVVHAIVFAPAAVLAHRGITEPIAAKLIPRLAAAAVKGMQYAETNNHPLKQIDLRDVDLF